MIVHVNTVVNVALSSIQHDLGFTTVGLAWPVNAYMIALGGTLVLAGRFGDLIGTKRIFMTGILIFTVASARCLVVGIAISAFALQTPKETAWLESEEYVA